MQLPSYAQVQIYEVPALKSDETDLVIEQVEESSEDEEIIEETVEGASTQKRGRRCILAVSFVLVLLLLAAVIAVLHVSALRDTSSASAPENTIFQFGQASQSQAFTPAPGGGFCSESDQAILSKRTGGSGEGSLGLATYQCVMQSWSIISLVDADAFTKCLNEKTAVSTSCGKCYADFTSWGITNCAMACMSSWCSAECLQCNNQHKESLDSCTGFVGGPQNACDVAPAAETIVSRKLAHTSNLIAV